MVNPTTPGYWLGLYEKSMPNRLTLEEKLLAARESGYDFLELSIDETDEKLARLRWTGGERDQALRAIRETGVPIGSICLSGHRKYPMGHPDPAVRVRSMEIMAQTIALAGELGVRIIQLAGYDVYYGESTAETRARFGENLHKAVEMAAREGVILAFETMETDFMNTVQKAMRWVEEVGSPYLQVYPDAGNITNAAVAAGKDVAEDLLAGKNHLAAVHLKETKPGIFREVPYGAGHVDFGKITDCAWRLGVRRYLAEFWYDGSDGWRQTIRENDRFLRAFLDKAALENWDSFRYPMDDCNRRRPAAADAVITAVRR